MIPVLVLSNVVLFAVVALLVGVAWWVVLLAAVIVGLVAVIVWLLWTIGGIMSA